MAGFFDYSKKIRDELAKNLLGIDPAYDSPAMAALGGAMTGNFGDAADITKMRVRNLFAKDGDPEYKAMFPNTQPIDPVSAGLGFAPMGLGMIKNQFGRIAENGIDANKLAGMLERAGIDKGYFITRESSNVSPSQYLTFSNGIDDSIRQIRISNHADKYPELASGKRYSTDPVTENTFENAVNWLAKEGYPTKLSNKYSNIPDYSEHLLQQRILRETPEYRLKALQEAWLNKPKATRGKYPTIEDLKIK